MRIVVVGPGAMGCLFAGFFYKSDHDVWILDNDSKRAAVLANRGISIDDAAGSKNIKVNITSDANAIGEADLVFLCVKSFDTANAVDSISPLIGNETLVISLQNGYGNVECIAQKLDRKRVVCAITAHGSTWIEQGHVIHAGEGHTQVAALDSNSSEKAELVRSLLVECGIKASKADDIESMIWSKLVINAAINPLTAVSDVRNGQIVEDAELMETMRRTVQEAAAVARAQNVDLAFDCEIDEVEKVCRATKDNISSMLQDIRMGRQTEIEAITGVILKKAHEHGIDVPSNEILLQSVRKLEKKTV